MEVGRLLPLDLSGRRVLRFMRKPCRRNPVRVIPANSESWRTRMRRYLLKRLLLMLPMLLGITMISFAMMNLVPGEPAMMYIDTEREPPTPEKIAEINQMLGLDKPIVIRYGIWLKGILSGNFGYSLMTRQPVLKEISARIGTTVSLSLLSMMVSVLFGILIGVYCAVKQYSFADYLLSTVSFVWISIPSFWLAMMMILLFTNTLRWLPSVGLNDMYLKNPTFWQALVDRARHVIMPVMAMSLSSIGGWARYQRSSFLDVKNQDYIRTARSKGLPERTIIFRHALRNAALPIITMLGMTLPGLIGGSMIVENIFGLPGMGRLAMTAIEARDYPVIMGITLMSSILVLMGSFLADLLYAVVDPRIRYQ